MNKKAVSLLLAGVLGAMALAGCGKTVERTAQTQEEAAETAEEGGAEADTGAETEEAGEEDGVDPITGERYPDAVNIGTLNGSIQTAVGLEEGWFDELGVKVNFLYFDSGRDVNNAFASGSVDLASFGSSPISLGVSSDLNYEVVFLNDVIGSAESLVVKNDAEISDVAGLKGKKVATPFASTSHYSLLNALQLAGVDAADVEILDMQPQDILAAWTRGDIDAAYIWNPILAELEKDGTVLTDSEKLAEQGVVAADLSAAGKEFAEKYPTLVTEYVKVFIKTYELIDSDPERVVQDTAANLGITEEEAQQQLFDNKWISGEEQLSDAYLGTSGSIGALADTIKSTADFHVAQGNLESAPELDVFVDAVNPAFVEAALGK